MLSAMGDGETLLEVSGLVKVYGRRLLRRGGSRALDGIDLCVGRGSVFGLLGPNGAGKTTLVKILLDLVRGWSGEVRLFGLPPRIPQARRRVGYLPEAHRLPPYLTGRQVMRLFGMLAGRPRREVDRRAPELLERVGMLSAADQKVREYSKGMQQRLGLAQALVHDPELLLLDEPTDGVDPVGRKAIRELVVDLRQRGVTVFVNSHLLAEVEMVCDRVVILHEGRVLREGTVDELTRETGAVGVELACELPGGLAATLEREFPKARIDGRRISLRAGDEELNRLVDRLRAQNVLLRAVERHRLTLEEAFIDLVGEDRR